MKQKRSHSAWISLPAMVMTLIGAEVVCGLVPQNVDARAVEPEPYLRVVEEDGVVRLEVASRSFKRAGSNGAAGGLVVHLVGVTHIGQQAYYEQIQGWLEAQDVVMFEGVMPKAMRELGPGAAFKDADEGEDGEAGIQRQIADAFGLAFQLEEIDYDHAGWRNSDMTMEDLSWRFAGHDGPYPGDGPSLEQIEAQGDDEGDEGGSGNSEMDALMGMLDGSSGIAKVAGVMLKLIGSSPMASAMGRVMMVEMLSRADELMAAAPGGMGDFLEVLIGERNQVVLDDLAEFLETEPETKSIAIFYGAGHLADMEQRLAEQLDLKPVESKWFDAITIDLEEERLNPFLVKQIRMMLSSTIDQQLKMMEQ